MSTFVSIPSGHGGCDAQWYIMVSLCLVGHQFCSLGWSESVRKVLNIGPKRPHGSMVKGMRTIFLRLVLLLCLLPKSMVRLWLLVYCVNLVSVIYDIGDLCLHWQ